MIKELLLSRFHHAKKALYCLCAATVVLICMTSSTFAQQSLPDLVAISTAGPTLSGPGQSISITYTLKNQGAVDAPDFQVGLYLSADAVITTSDILVETVDICGLHPGAQLTVPATFSVLTNVATGTYYIGMIADINGNVQESDKSNNSIAGNQITISNSPNFVITSFSGPATIYTGQGDMYGGNGALAVTLTVTNNGFSRGLAYVHVYYSQTPQITTSSIFINAVGTGYINPGQSSTVSTPLHADLKMAGGSYYLVAKVTNVHDQSKVNTSVGNLITVVGPDLLTTAVSGPQTGYVGDSIVVNNTVAMQGIVFDYGDGNCPQPASVNVNLCLFQADKTTLYTCLGQRSAMSGWLLVAGTTSSDNTVVTIPVGVTPGTYYIGASAEAWVYDPAYNVSWIAPENNTSNNILISADPITILSH